MNLTPKQRENAYTREHKTAFIIGIMLLAMPLARAAFSAQTRLRRRSSALLCSSWQKTLTTF